MQPSILVAYLICSKSESKGVEVGVDGREAFMPDTRVF